MMMLLTVKMEVVVSWLADGLAAAGSDAVLTLIDAPLISPGWRRNSPEEEKKEEEIGEKEEEKGGKEEEEE